MSEFQMIKAVGVMVGDAIEIFGTKRTVRKTVRIGDEIRFWFVGMEGRPQIAMHNTALKVFQAGG